MVDIFDEVNEDLRAERARNLVIRYGGAIVGVVIAIVGAAVGWQAWNWWSAKQDAAAATSYLSVMAASDSATPAAIAARPAAIAVFDGLAGKAPDGYRVLAKFRAAALKADTGDLAGALALWDQIAADGAVDPLLRELASLLWAQHQIDHGDPAIVTARLQPLTAPGGRWRTMALEQLALLDLRQGKVDDARTNLRKLAEDIDAPAGVRGRASSLNSRLGG